MTKKHVYAILIVTIMLLSGCNNLQLQEYDGISFNNSSYHLAWEWKPVREKLKDKTLIHLEDYDSSVDYGKGYDAIGFAGDVEHVFLFFNHQLYVKDEYKFPDISDVETKILKVVFHHPNQILPTKEKLVLENEFASMFTQEYRNSIGGQYRNLNRWNPLEYEVGFYIHDYFAYFSGISVGSDSTGHFGIIDRIENVPRVRLFSNELNQKLSEKLN